MVRALQRAGWEVKDQRGSHVGMVNSEGRKVSVPVHATHDLKPGIRDAILRDAGLSADDLRRLLGRR
jgi:predicted RNA binding protein YcfA (HicA-like mRNA interferase family)